MSANIIDANLAICKMLGIATAGQNVVAVDLHMQVGKLPAATVTRQTLGVDITTTSQTFELHPIGQPEAEPLDLDAMCSGALHRLNLLIDRLCTQAQIDTHRGFLQAARNLGFATRERLHDTDIELHYVNSATPIFVNGAPA